MDQHLAFTATLSPVAGVVERLLSILAVLIPIRLIPIISFKTLGHARKSGARSAVKSLKQAPRGSTPYKMFGFGRKKVETESVRRQQIEKLKSDIPLARALNQEESAFDIPMPSASPSALLRVVLPPQFPEQAPVFKLIGVAVRHPWIDATGIVSGHPRLNPWDVNNSISVIAEQIITEVTKVVGGSPTVGSFFSQNPSPVGGVPTGYPGQSIPYQPGSSTGIGSAIPYVQQPPPPYGGLPHRPPGPGQQQQSQPSAYGAMLRPGGSGMPDGGAAVQPRRDRPTVNLPAVPTNLPDLADRPVEELNVLLSDEVQFSVYFMGLGQVKECSRILEGLRRSNAQLAKSNLSEKDELEKLRTEVAELQGVLRDMKGAYEGKLRSNRSVTRSMGVPEVMAELEKQQLEAEDRSEDIARSFVYGEMKLSEFAIEFLKHRKAYHERSAKIEKLAALGPQR